jgi:hypothetical protein
MCVFECAGGRGGRGAVLCCSVRKTRRGGGGGGGVRGDIAEAQQNRQMCLYTIRSSASCSELAEPLAPHSGHASRLVPMRLLFLIVSNLLCVFPACCCVQWAVSPLCCMLIA